MAGSASLLWVIAAVVGFATVAPNLERIADIREEREAAGGFAIPRAPDGQFYVEGRIGDAPTRFLVDQGADSVILTAADAERLGISPGSSVTLPSLAIGPVQAREVVATVSPDLPVSLLGRSFLGRVAVDVRRDRMVLR